MVGGEAGGFAAVIGVLAAAMLAAQLQQNPSPMVEHTRAHGRLKEAEPPGERFPLSVGTLYVPRGRRAGRKTPLAIHFHGAPWIAETAAAKLKIAVISVSLGAGSRVYAEPFRDPDSLAKLLRQAEQESRRRFPVAMLSSWSAGYGAVREILKHRENWALVDRVAALDSIHAGYPSGRPGPLESELDASNMEAFEQFAREAMRSRKRFLITHTEIFPGTFASTTETADYLISRLGLRRKAVLAWGPLGTQQLSEVRRGGFRVLGYAGNAAPDHLDHIHALAPFWRMLR